MKRVMLEGSIRVLMLAVWLGVAVVLTGCASRSEGAVLSHDFAEPLAGAKAATYEFNAGDGNLAIASLAGSAQTLASGTLQYLQGEAAPVRSLVSGDGLATLTLTSGQAPRRWLRFPWAACNGATEWRIQLNPVVVAQITAHSDGGNLTLDLARMAVTRVAADTGGGNIEVALPEQAASLGVTASTGAGNVVVRIPDGVAARIHATTGAGQVRLDPRFSPAGKDIYQSADYGTAANRVEVTARSGAGNVVIE